MPSRRIIGERMREESSGGPSSPYKQRSEQSNSGIVQTRLDRVVKNRIAVKESSMNQAVHQNIVRHVEENFSLTEIAGSHTRRIRRRDTEQSAAQLQR